MEDKETYTKEEMEKIAQDIRNEQAINDFGKQWFLTALSYTASLVNQNSIPQEAHQCGQIFYNQFMVNTGQIKAPAGKPPEKETEKEKVMSDED